MLIPRITRFSLNPCIGDKKLRKDSFKFFELIKLKKEEGEKNKVRTAIDKRKVRIRNKL